VTRKLFIFLLVALIVAAPAAAAGSQSIDRSLLMPGVTYTRQVQFTPHGPEVLHVINAPKPGGLYSLMPLLSNDAIVGREKVTSMQKRASTTATVAGVNGDLFNWNDGHPSGGLMQNGFLLHPPLRDRSTVGIDTEGNLRVERVSFSGYWIGSGQRRTLQFNELPGPNGVSLFTPTWGPVTPGVQAVEAVLQPFPGAKPNTDLTGVVAQVSSTSGSTPVPPDGAVLQARGSAAAKLAAEAPVGTTVTVRFALNPTWDGVVNALGGGPLIVANGKPIFRANEGFDQSQLSPRNPRTAIGQRADGRLLLVAVDGRQPGYSVGMSNFELALAMMQLGAVTASALDAGGSTTMAFDGQLLNRPSDPGGERPVAESLVVAYTGVYAPPVSEPALSPNGDGVAETETLSYKLVRPSTVTATLIAPDKTVREIDSGLRQPGIYKFPWSGKTVEDAVEPEGSWRFSVTATDDQAVPSAADRIFQLNNTLGSLAVQPSALKLRKKGTRLSGSFTLARPAKVTATIETAGGIVVRVLARGPFDAGPRVLTWNGRNGVGGLAYGGSYRLHVVANNELGRVDLRAAFTARR
jgi:Exopolysaccharide biosynthesis protein related to N-acetylglucosamine-1-phosphodiester alpha-N-acetylglucosaminidase